MVQFRLLLFTCVMIGCAHIQTASSPLQLVASVIFRDWHDLNVNALRRLDPALVPVASVEGCEGAVFLQSTTPDRNSSAPATMTVTFELEFTPSSAGRCHESLSVVTLSRRSEDLSDALAFAGRVAETLQLQRSNVSLSIPRTLSEPDTFAWTDASESQGLHRRDLEVRRESGLWLTRYREYRHTKPGES